eukprot:gene10689-biopygen13865
MRPAPLRSVLPPTGHCAGVVGHGRPAMAERGPVKVEGRYRCRLRLMPGWLRMEIATDTQDVGRRGKLDQKPVLYLSDNGHGPPPPGRQGKADVIPIAITRFQSVCPCGCWQAWDLLGIRRSVTNWDFLDGNMGQIEENRWRIVAPQAPPKGGNGDNCGECARTGAAKRKTNRQGTPCPVLSCRTPARNDVPKPPGKAEWR